jgi:hypothetical protein
MPYMLPRHAAPSTDTLQGRSRRDRQQTQHSKDCKKQASQQATVLLCACIDTHSHGIGDTCPPALQRRAQENTHRKTRVATA